MTRGDAIALEIASRAAASIPGAGLVAGPVMERLVPYVTRARWRAGPLGQELPDPPGRLPAPNPIIRAAGGRRARRAARASALIRPRRV